MGHQTIHADVREVFQRFTEPAHVISGNAETPHSGVNFEMNARYYSRVASNLIQALDHIEPVNHWRQTLAQTGCLLAGPESSQAQNGLADARVTQFLLFFRQRDAEPINTGRLQSPRALDCAMPVGIRFY